MNSRKPTLDGFLPRRSSRVVKLNEGAKRQIKDDFFEKTSSLTSSEIDQPNTTKSANTGYGASVFGSSSNNDWFFEQPTKKSILKKKRQEKNQFSKKPKRAIWKIMRFIGLVLIICVISLGAYVAYRVVSASGSIFGGSLVDIFRSNPLQQDENGRSNFLIIGTSEDDPGHESPELTDSIMIASIDQVQKDLFLFSIPRDLEIEYGRACVAGYRGKINALYACVNEGKTLEDEQERLDVLRKSIGDVLGIDLQYAVHVNYTVLKDVINAIGGKITINIESSDPRGYLDSQLDDQFCGISYSDRITNCPPRGHYVDYPNGITELTAQEALNLSRARGDSSPTYGYASSNFEREKNQRKILVAIKDKALSTGTLTNMSSVMNLIDALENNLRTNVQTSEVKTLLELSKEIDSSRIHSLDMLGDEIMKGDGNPSAGKYNYSELQKYLARKLSNNPVIRENAPLIVLNGTKQIGLAQQKANELKDLGFNVYYVDNAPEGTYSKTEIYKVGDDCSETVESLEKLFNTERQSANPPLKTDGLGQIILIIGDDQLTES